MRPCLITEAAAAINRGWKLIRVERNGKKAIDRGWPVLTKSAAQAWARQGGNLGVLTGEPSGIVVVDIDWYKGRTDIHEDLLERLSLMGCAAASTPRGGIHCYLRGSSARNKASALGIDIRGTGGYVVLPGSNINGNFYQWTVPPEEAEDFYNE